MKTFEDGISIRKYKDNDCGVAMKLFGDGIMSHVKGDLAGMEEPFQKFVDENLLLYDDMDTMLGAENGGRMFVAVNQVNEVVGTVGLAVTEGDAEKKSSELLRMTVRADMQGQGVGRRLLEVLVEYAKNELKCESIHLSTLEAFGAANKLYKKFGFTTKRTSEIPVGKNGKVRVIVYEKRLV